MDATKLHPKPKVVFVLGATATGKSKLAIALAASFDGEVINSDKIQVYDGVSVITNKVTNDECAGVPHHLIGGVHPDADFTAYDFRRQAANAISYILSKGRLPVVAGGSNTYIEALVDGDDGAFRKAHDCLFIWLDVEPELLNWYTSVRVDDMVQRGLVDEARVAFNAAADYSKGVRRAIGLPEIDAYLRAERMGTVHEGALAEMLKSAIADIKANTFKLALAQTEKIRRLSTLDGWDVRCVDCTDVHARMAEGACHKATWEKVVWEPCESMVRGFLECTGVVANDNGAVGEEKVEVSHGATADAGYGGGGNNGTAAAATVVVGAVVPPAVGIALSK